MNDDTFVDDELVNHPGEKKESRERSGSSWSLPMTCRKIFSE